MHDLTAARKNARANEDAAAIAWAQDRIEELEAALRAFADFYTPAMELAGDGHPLTQGSTLAHKQITVGDVRRAYKALST